MPTLGPEDLAQWYLRLNGFLTLSNFVVHPDRRGSQLTDADIVGVRFPHREEFSGWGTDAAMFRRSDKPMFVLAEVKRSQGGLNDSWQDWSVIRALLIDLGFVRRDVASDAAEDLVQKGAWDEQHLSGRVLCIAEYFGPERRGVCTEITWDEVMGFLYERFTYHGSVKTDHNTWDAVGKALWSCWEANRSLEKFFLGVRKLFGLQATAPSEAVGVRSARSKRDAT